MVDATPTATPDATPATAPPLSLVKLRDRHVALMQAYGDFDDEPSAAFLDDVAAFQQQAGAAGVGISGPDERFEAQSTINYWQTVRINAGQRPTTTLLAEFDHEAARRQAGEKSPYMGLAPFQTDDNQFFSGRYELVRTMVSMVKSKRLLALTGLSGSGKSSVVRAGIIPDLQQGAYDGIDDDGLTDSSKWLYPQPILPGIDPLAALAAVYGPIDSPRDLPAALDRAGAPVFLTIDQFEEVFTLSEPGPNRTLFLDALVAAATQGVHRHMVVITMRSEYDTFVQAHEAFGALFKGGRVVIEAMQSNDLRKAIEEPAKRLGVGFEPGLIDELLTRVQGEPAGLPLLGFTLLELWKRRDGGPMKMADYQALGGNPRDILARRADEVFDALLQQDQDLARGIFTTLVKIGDSLEATSRRVKRAELNVVSGARDNVDRVLGILLANGLIRMAPTGPITPETDIEVAHEALIRNWGRLSQWVKESFGEQTNRKAFALRAAKWEDGGGDLLSGLSLDEANRKFKDLDAAETKFLAASNRHVRYRQRVRLAVTGAFAVLSLALGLMLWRQYDERAIERQGRRLEQLAAQSDALVEGGDTMAKRALFAVDTDPETSVSTVKTLWELIRRAVGGDPDELWSFLGSFVPAVGGDPDVLPPAAQALLQATALNQPGIEMLKATGAPLGVSYAEKSDPLRIMSLWDDGAARVWTRRGGGFSATPPIVLAIPGRRITAAALSPDGRSAFTASLEGARSMESEAEESYSEIWNLDDVPAGGRPTYREMRRSPDAGEVSSIKYDPRDGKRVLVATEFAGAILVDSASGKNIGMPIPPVDPLNVAIFSPDGKKILTGDEGGFVALYDAATGGLLYEVPASQKSVATARFTPSGARFAVGGDDNIIRLFNAGDGEELYQLVGHAKPVTSIAIGSDGGTLVSGSADGTVRLWDLGITAGKLLRTVTPAGRDSAINAVAFAPDNESIAVASGEGAVRLLNLAGTKLLRTSPLWLTGSNEPKRESIGMSPDHRTILVTRTTVPKEGGRTKAEAPGYPFLETWDVVRRQLAAVSFAGAERRIDSIENGLFSGDGKRMVLVFNPDPRDAPYRISLMTSLGGAAVFEAPANEGVTQAGLSFDGTAMTILTPVIKRDDTLDEVTIGHQLNIWRQGDMALRPVPLEKSNPLARGGLFAPDGPYLVEYAIKGPQRFAVASASNRWTVVHDARTGRMASKFASEGNVESLAFSPDGRTIFAGTDTGTGALWDAATGALLARLSSRHDNGIRFVKFSADGSKLVTTSIDATARVWNAADGKLLHVLTGHEAGVTDASFSPDGKRVLTSADDRKVMLWDVATGKRLTTLRGPAKSRDIRGWFSADGRHVQTLSSNGALRTWNVATPEQTYTKLRQVACKGGGQFTDDEIKRYGLPNGARLDCVGVDAAP